MQCVDVRACSISVFSVATVHGHMVPTWKSRLAHQHAPQGQCCASRTIVHTRHDLTLAHTSRETASLALARA